MNGSLMSYQVFFPRERFITQFTRESFDLQVYFGNVTLQSTLPSKGLAVDVAERAAE